MSIASSTVTSTATSSTTYFWTDQAATVAAGSKVTTYPSTDEYPSTITSTYNLTAGSQAGLHGTTTDVQDGQNAWHSTADFSLGSMSSHTTERLVDEGTRSWTNDASYGDGSSFHCSGAVQKSGVGSMTVVGGGTTTTINYQEDTSGDGTVDGTSPEEPATFEWTSDGTTTIHYADGTSETLAPA